MQALVSYDFLAIKQFVFATDRLREIRGGSAALDHLNRKAIPEAVLSVDPSARVVYSAGGTGLIVTTPEKMADVSDVCYRTCREVTESAQLRTAHLCLSDSQAQNPDLGAVLRNLAARLQIEKRRNVREMTSTSHSLLLPCELCGDNYASEVLSEPKHSDLEICRACKLRNEFDRSIRQSIDRGDWAGPWTSLEKALVARGVSLAGRRRAESFDDLCQGELLALIYADGDDLGSIFDGSTSLDEVGSRSAAIEDALSEALADAVMPYLTDGPSEVLPFDLIFLGGDDLVVATTPAAAIQIAPEVARRFTEHAGRLLQRHASLSVGIGIAPSTHPFRQLLNDSQDALRNAKSGRFLAQRNSKTPGRDTSGYINYVISGDARQIEVPEDSLASSTMRPFSLSRLEQLLSVVPDVRKLPASKLQALRATAFMDKSQAMLNGLMVFARMNSAQRTIVVKIMSELAAGKPSQLLWVPDGLNMLNPWSDLADLSELVGTGFQAEDEAE